MHVWVRVCHRVCVCVALWALLPEIDDDDDGIISHC